MTTLPAILPAAVAVCVFVAGVGVVLLPVCAWTDWRDAQRARERAQQPVSRPNSPPRQSGMVGALTEPHSAFRERVTDPEALSAPESPSGAADPPAPHPTDPKPSQSRTARQETP